jgi:signal peptidase I
LLSLLFPGLGQAFRGAYRRGICFAAADLLLILIATQSSYAWPVFPAGIAFGVIWLSAAVLLFVVTWWVVIDAFLFRGNDPQQLTQRWARYLVYAGFVVILGSREFAEAFAHWEPFSIPSSSMEPTALPGDNILTINGYYRSHLPRRGELVIFALPRDPSVDFFKRVVGLPGDLIQMKDGVLYVNGAPIRREAIGPYVFTGNLRRQIFREYREVLDDGASYLIALEGDDQPLENTKPFTVPPGRYFMLGDNRDNSADSRDPDSGVGFVPISNFKAHPAFIYFSLDGSARWWEFWKWPHAIRWDRIGLVLN